MKEIKIDVSSSGGWIPMVVEGDIACPQCGGMMVLVVNMVATYAFCGKCRTYFYRRGITEIK